MVYDRFSDELELTKSVLSFSFVNKYPKVSSIAGNRINPDIDILQIDKISENQFKLIGYELKLMKFSEKTKALGWETFYRGIGEALMYLRNGVDRAFLVLGFHKNVPTDEIIDKFRQCLLDEKKLLESILGNYISIGICLYSGRVDTIVEASNDFYTVDKKINLLREELLQKKFRYDKKLIPK